jgi:multicomponent Na+:H+ antiporter subunit F
MNNVLTVFLVVLFVAGALTTWWIARPNSLANRAISIDVLASLITCGLLVGASFSGDGLLLELAIVLGLLGFLTAVTVARFIERTGQ